MKYWSLLFKYFCPLYICWAREYLIITFSFFFFLFESIYAQCLLIIFKIQCDDNIIRSISSVQRINKNTDISEEFIEFWELRKDNYQQFTIKNILFNYFIIKNKDKTIKPKISKSSKQNEIKSSNLLRIGSLNFPKTMDLFQWGQVHFILEDSEAIYIKVNQELDTSSSL